MVAYTVDTSAVLVYLVDKLPESADRLFREAEAGETVLEFPAIAAVECLYRGEKGITVRGTDITTDADELAEAFEDDIPIEIVSDERDSVNAIPPLTDPFPNQMHDAMIVASHRARETEAIVTSDGMVDEIAPTIWK